MVVKKSPRIPKEDQLNSMGTRTSHDFRLSQKFFFIQTTNYTSSSLPPNPPNSPHQKKNKTNQPKPCHFCLFGVAMMEKKTHVPRHPDVSIRGVTEVRGGRRERPENDMYRSRRRKKPIGVGRFVFYLLVASSQRLYTCWYTSTDLILVLSFLKI